MTQASTSLWHGISLLPTWKNKTKQNIYIYIHILNSLLHFIETRMSIHSVKCNKKWKPNSTQRVLLHLECDVTKFSYFVEVSEGVMEVLPRLIGLKDKGAVRVAVGLQRPASGPLLLGLQLLGMVWHHVPWCHCWLQETKPSTEMRLINI